MAHTATEVIRSPIITNLTIQSACWNRSHIEIGAPADGMASPSAVQFFRPSESRGPGIHDRGDGPSQVRDRNAERHRLAPPKTRNCEKSRPPPCIDTPPKVTKLGRDACHPEVSCADWVNGRLSRGLR